KNYQIGRALTSEWCKDHPRLVDFLALLQLGYRLAAHRLGLDDSAKASETFAREVYHGLNLRTKRDEVLKVLAAPPQAWQWVERGFIPNVSLITPQLREVDCLGLLKSQGLAQKSDSRKGKDPWGDPESQRGIVLTEAGRERLRALIESQDAA